MNDKGSVLSYHIIQSFAPDEANIEQVMQAGQMLCDRLLKGHYQFVLATNNNNTFSIVLLIFSDEMNHLTFYISSHTNNSLNTFSTAIKSSNIGMY